MALNDDVADLMIVQKQKHVKGFENVDKTKEYKERTYYKFVRKNTSDIVEINAFWIDLAEYIIQNNGNVEGFLSKNFIYATRNHTEMIGVLTFMGNCYFKLYVKY